MGRLVHKAPSTHETVKISTLNSGVSAYLPGYRPKQRPKEGGMQGGGRGRLGGSLQSRLGPVVFCRLPGTAQLLLGRDPDSPAPREKMPLWVMVYRVIVQPEAASQHPMWWQAQPFSSPVQSLGGGGSLVLAARVLLSHLPRTGSSRLPPLFLCRPSSR